MKPLSALNFSRNNKKRLITSIITVLAAVAFIYLLQTFVRSIYASVYQISVVPYKTHMSLYNLHSNTPIPDHIITEVKENENIERIIPFRRFGTKFVMPGSMSDTDVFLLRTEDMEYVMNKHNMKLLEGRLPKEDTSEIALNIKVARNKKVKLGDKVGSEVDKTDYLPGQYTVVGILDSESFFSILPYHSKGGLKSVLIFPKENRYNEVQKLLSSFPKHEVRAAYLSDVEKIFEDNTEVMKILDLICILAIVVMVIATGSSKYVQFFNRRQELGILNAIGYTKLKIMKKTLLEVSLINLTGFLLGIIFGVLGSFFLTESVFVSSGGIGVFLYYKAFLMSLFIPLFTTIFTLIPVNRMITRLDPINMIEGVI